MACFVLKFFNITSEIFQMFQANWVSVMLLVWTYLLILFSYLRIVIQFFIAHCWNASCASRILFPLLFLKYQNCTSISCKHHPKGAAICRILKKPEILLSKTHYSNWFLNLRRSLNFDTKKSINQQDSYLKSIKRSVVEIGMTPLQISRRVWRHTPKKPCRCMRLP